MMVLGKKLLMAVILVCVFLALSLVVVVAYAQSIVPTPSVPELALKIYNFEKMTVDFTIKNQPLPTNTSNSNLTLFYKLRFKDHDSDVWPIIPNIYQVSSSSENTTFSLFLLPGYSTFAKSQVWDFQVQAIFGNYSNYYDPNVIIFPGMPNGGYVTIFEPIISSDWSNTQTLNLAIAPASPSASPTTIPSPSPAQTMTPTESPTPQPTTTPSPTPTLIPTSSQSTSFSSSPSPSPSLSPTPSPIPTVSPIITPSDSPTQQPTEPSAKQNNAQENLTPVIIIAALAVAVVVAALLVRKRKGLANE